MVLMAELQSGKLSMDAYLQRLRVRIAADRALAVHLKKAGQLKEAVLVFKCRVKVMQTELAGAEEAGAA
jgi:hypothetical protein